MRNAPEFMAIAVWGLFASVVAVAQGAGPGPRETQTPAISVPAEVPMAERLWTGRSAAVAKPDISPYGALYIDPSLDEGAPVAKAPKPTSGDLTAQ
jgi:hypothetical protein